MTVHLSPIKEDDIKLGFQNMVYSLFCHCLANTSKISFNFVSGFGRLINGGLLSGVKGVVSK